MISLGLGVGVSRIAAFARAVVGFVFNGSNAFLGTDSLAFGPVPQGAMRSALLDSLDFGPVPQSAMLDQQLDELAFAPVPQSASIT